MPLEVVCVRMSVCVSQAGGCFLTNQTQSHRPIPLSATDLILHPQNLWRLISLLSSKKTLRKAAWSLPGASGASQEPLEPPTGEPGADTGGFFHATQLQ